MEATIEKLKDQARKSWDGKIGEQRAIDLEIYLRNKLEEYSNALGIPQKKILEAWEKNRTYSAINYYQEANQPSIDADDVRIFDTTEKMHEAIGDPKFRCPACNGITTNPYECNSGNELVKGKVCDWKVYGFFGALGKGTYVYVKGERQGETIFTPIAWEKDKQNVDFLIDRLYKECANTNDYVGVEHDNLWATDEVSLMEDLFDKIMRELSTLEWNAEEYLQSHDEDAPFRSLRNVRQHQIRLKKFVHKYAEQYLPQERANAYMKEADQYNM